MSVRENLIRIKSEIPENVKLIAVSKFHSAETIQEAYEAGQRLFGESRVQELEAKQAVLPKDIAWHFIGTLQKNKVKYIAPYVYMIQSVDSVELFKEIDNQANKNNRIIKVLLEIHIAKESGKHGFTIEECKKLFADNLFLQTPNVEICGLMGMATFTDDIEILKSEFHALKKLFEEIREMAQTDSAIFSELSMGMSDDFKTAIEQGSTMVRIGTKIFGER
jgi:pyridoxal phosphate enzyme (YggS family)